MELTAMCPRQLCEQLVGLLEQHAAQLPGRAVDRELWERALLGPARELLGRPGKSFRAQLVESTYRIAGGDLAALPPELPLVVEIVHAGSLVVDDIEDGSTTRRGAPALHTVYGLPLALNMANWLYFWPMVLLDHAAIESDRRQRIQQQLHRTLLDCHSGQALDLGIRVHELERARVRGLVASITSLKTASLMAFAACLGAVAAGSPPATLEAVRRFGHSMGTALQMLDDLGGLLSRQRSHKLLEDLLHARATWPWAWLAETAPPGDYEALRRRLVRVCGGEESPELLVAGLRRSVAELGRRRVAERLRAGFDRLERRVGRSPALGLLRAEVHRLEVSYG
jgi:geranylgeranyl pyrophosphate synthase